MTWLAAYDDIDALVEALIDMEASEDRAPYPAAQWYDRKLLAAERELDADFANETA